MILAIETATEVCGVAIVHGGDVIAQRIVVEKNVHSEKLLPMIDEVFRESSLSLRAVDAIAVSIGPGSFTGLRIGLSTAKGLAVAQTKRVIPVPTLDALAFEYHRCLGTNSSGVVCSLIDAKRDEVYYSFYEAGASGIRRLSEYDIAPVSNVAEAAAQYGSVIFVGDGAAKMETVAEMGGPLLRRSEITCNPVSVGMLAENEAELLSKESLSSLEPMYIREFLATRPAGRRLSELQQNASARQPIAHSRKD